MKKVDKIVAESSLSSSFLSGTQSNYKSLLKNSVLSKISDQVTPASLVSISLTSSLSSALRTPIESTFGVVVFLFSHSMSNPAPITYFFYDMDCSVISKFEEMD